MPVIVTRRWAGSLDGEAPGSGSCLTPARRLLLSGLCPLGSSIDRYKMESLQEVQGMGSLAQLGAGRAG